MPNTIWNWYKATSLPLWWAGEISDISNGSCKVKLDQGEIIANPISVKSVGEKTTVSIRPERALINPKDKMDNNQKGKIEEVIYHGDHTRVRLNLLGNSEFILKVPNSSQNLDIKLGNEINIDKLGLSPNNHQLINVTIITWELPISVPIPVPIQSTVLW